MRGLLLDTHVLLWLLEDSARLGTEARGLIAQSPAVFVSAASTWELSIKAAIGKLALPEALDDVIGRSGLQDLPITRRHTLASDITALPHKDPFDAILLAQATVEGLALLTADAKLLAVVAEAVDARK
ncbi:type II toxin-antitoxin system VapC family toxin [Mycobacterium syngnathidarum]